jgi:hypothetical protein
MGALSYMQAGGNGPASTLPVGQSGRWAAARQEMGGNRNSSRRQPSRRAPSPAEPASMWVALGLLLPTAEISGAPSACCTVEYTCSTAYGSSPLLDHKLHLHIIEKATLHQKKIVSYAASISISAPVPHQIHQDSNQLDCFEKVQTRNTPPPFLFTRND